MHTSLHIYFHNKADTVSTMYTLTDAHGSSLRSVCVCAIGRVQLPLVEL